MTYQPPTQFRVLLLATALTAMSIACDSTSGPIGTSGADTVDTRPFVWQTFDYLPSAYKLNGLWALAADDVYGVGMNGVVVHWNGRNWGRVPADSQDDLWGIWGSGPDSLFVCGDNGTVLFSNPLYWRPMESSTNEDLRAIWGSSASSVYIVSDASRVHHYDGSAWSSPYPPLPNGLLDVWAPSDTSVYVVGLDGWVGRLNDQGWDLSTPTSEPLTSIHGAPGGHVFAVGNNGVVLRHEGGAWTPMDNTGDDALQAVWALDDDNVYAAGTNGTVLHFDGISWERIDILTHEWLFALAGSGDDVFAAGSGSMLHYDGAAWRSIAAGTVTPLRGAWASSGNSAFAVGDHGTILRYIGDSWFEMDSGTERDLRGIWGSSPKDVYAVGEARILHFQNGEWNREFGQVLSFNAIAGNDSIVVAVGNNGTVRLSTGDGTWSPANTYTNDNMAVWCAPDNAVYVTDTRGYIYRRDGDDWLIGPRDHTFQGALYAIVGRIQPETEDYEMFAAGEDGTILRETSVEDWAPMPSGTVATLRALGVGPSGVLYAAGDGGTLRYLDGDQWKVVPYATNAYVTDIAFTDDGELFVTGGSDFSSGVILYYGKETVARYAP